VTPHSVQVSRDAEEDSTAIFSRIAADNLEAADRFLHALDRELQLLSRLPGMGRKRTFRHPTLRDLRSVPVTGFRNYLIFYHVRQDEVTVLRILHGARNLRKVLLS